MAQLITSTVLSQELWDLGIYDSHCHPTDSPNNLHLIPEMKARTLTIMSTREHDQELVAQTSEKYGVDLPDEKVTELNLKGKCRVVPSFGWHPWFSHLLYCEEEEEVKEEEEKEKEKEKEESDDDDDDDDVSGGRHSHNSTSTSEVKKLHDDTEKKEQKELFKRKLLHYSKILTPEPEEEFIKFLPTPLSLQKFIKDTKERLERFPSACVGEIGLDRAFRLPWPTGYTYNNNNNNNNNNKNPIPQPPPPEYEETESKSSKSKTTHSGRHLSPYRVNLQHQKKVFISQLKLAGELKRPVSIHSVQSHGAVFDTLSSLWKGFELEVESNRNKKNRLKREKNSGMSKEQISWLRKKEEIERKERNYEKLYNEGKPLPFPPRICLHSFSAPPQTLQQYLNPPPIPGTIYPSDIYFSFSTSINLAHMDKLQETVKMVPESKVLIESDLHTAGPEMEKYLEEAVSLVSSLKGWDLRETIEKTGRNWRDWVFGKMSEGKDEDPEDWGFNDEGDDGESM